MVVSQLSDTIMVSSEQSPDDVVSLEMINEFETPLSEEEVMNFVASFDPFEANKSIPPTRSIREILEENECVMTECGEIPSIPPTRTPFEILEDNECALLKSLWGAQMPEISHPTEVIKQNNVKFSLKDCSVSCKDLQFSARYKAIVKRQIKQKKSKKRQPFYSSTTDLTTINLDAILQFEDHSSKIENVSEIEAVRASNSKISKMSQKKIIKDNPLIVAENVSEIEPVRSSISKIAKMSKKKIIKENPLIVAENVSEIEPVRSINSKIVKMSQQKIITENPLILAENVSEIEPVRSSNGNRMWVSGEICLKQNCGNFKNKWKYPQVFINESHLDQLLELRNKDGTTLRVVTKEHIGKVVCCVDHYPVHIQLIIYKQMLNGYFDWSLLSEKELTEAKITNGRGRCRQAVDTIHSEWRMCYRWAPAKEWRFIDINKKALSDLVDPLAGNKDNELFKQSQTDKKKQEKDFESIIPERKSLKEVKNTKKLNKENPDSLKQSEPEIKKQRKELEAIKQEFNGLKEQMEKKIAVFDKLNQSIHTIHNNIREDVLSLHSNLKINDEKLNLMGKQVGEVSKSQLELAKFNCRSQNQLAIMDATSASTIVVLQNLMQQMKEKKDRDCKKR